MEKEKPRLARLTAILTQLQSKRIITARELASKHQVSIRTIYRDIRTLEKSGIPIVTEEGVGYSVMDGYQLPPIMFTEEEANALITAEQIINRNKDTSLVQAYGNAVEKIKSVLRSSQKGKTELLTERLEIRSNVHQEKTSDYLILLQKALTNLQVVKIDYTSLQHKSTTRSVEPFALIHTNDNWLLLANCLLRKEFRAFRLDCIQHLAIQRDTFNKHELTLEQFYLNYQEKWKTTPDTPLTTVTCTIASNKKTYTMQKFKIEPFHVIGISVRTSNSNGQAAHDIQALWNQFMAEKVGENIPNKMSEEILSLYTNYEGDHTKPYDTILGCKVSSLATIPEGMTGRSFDGGTYVKFISKGDFTKGAVVDTWNEIWNSDLDRAYSADFEVYGEKSIDPTNGEAEVLVAING